MSLRHDTSVETWGRAHHGLHHLATPVWRDAVAEAARTTAEAGLGTTLAHGLGRSYGDSALNMNGGLVRTPGLDRLIAFDRDNGILRAEAGLSIDALLRVIVPAGWFVPVTPGTKFVTLGGAVANDVHGKNHHVAGCFGRHVRRLALWRSDRGVVECGPEVETDLFRATVGGLGLTGIVLWVEIALIPIRSAMIEVENIRFDDLDGFFDLSEGSADWPYSVAWVDTIHGGERFGRGVFSRGRHAETGGLKPHRSGGPTVPFDAPSGLLNRVTVGVFNKLYYAKPGSAFRGRQHYDGFFYPLDRLRRWNRLYGRRGFYQWQGVVPPDDARAATETLLRTVTRSGEASFLAVLKNFGDMPSPGLLSFPMAGTTLALDLPNRGERTLGLMAELDRVVGQASGRLYPAKDGRMPAAAFQAGYASWRELERLRDPLLMSDFWRRVSDNNGG